MKQNRTHKLLVLIAIDLYFIALSIGALIVMYGNSEWYSVVTKMGIAIFISIIFIRLKEVLDKIK